MQPHPARLRATFVHLAGTLGKLLLAPRLSAPFPLFGEAPRSRGVRRPGEGESEGEREPARRDEPASAH
jgi:hypothetical protein